MQQDTVNIQIGKNGITTALVTEIKKHLKANKSVRIKLLKSFIKDKDRKQVALDLDKKLNKKGKLIGFVYTIKNG